MEMQWSIVDDSCIIDLMDLGHRNTANNDINTEFLRSTEDGGVYIFDSMNLGQSNNMHNNGKESYCICLGDFSIGSRAIRMPQPCSHIFHQHCITEWLNISHT
ncbi:hypothetical protein PHAVU_011G178500 [Phaseolus vulgaris]|uniref:RING-type domain-containing protein n=1 Tax=Phaseolus vulgaris TaxID=3885 RepID=V7AJJ0_PHAVU|nr:hypothetical protein PHAVU_011G178500g [Phaseolus vulgaris]ESW05430.1 hypothetical protein PHAVU_011G178500g [Phaseolus vulgaris]